VCLLSLSERKRAVVLGQPAQTDLGGFQQETLRQRVGKWLRVCKFYIHHDYIKNKVYKIRLWWGQHGKGMSSKPQGIKKPGYMCEM